MLQYITAKPHVVFISYLKQGLDALKNHFQRSRIQCNTADYLPIIFDPPRNGKNHDEVLCELLVQPMPAMNRGWQGEQQATFQNHGPALGSSSPAYYHSLNVEDQTGAPTTLLSAESLNSSSSTQES